ncbi:hypothetical protein AWENTII_008062 [Aspergillus wentii]
MAIWPFGRKNKRHTIQLGAPETADSRLSHEVAPGSVPGFEADLGGAPSRKSSKRQKNRHSHPVEDISSLNDAIPSSPPHHLTYHPPPTAHSERLPSRKGVRDPSLRKDRRVDVYTSHSSVGQDQPAMSRTPSLLRKRNENGPAVLKKRLSKRKAHEIAREQEIRMMVSSPIDIPRRRTDQFLDAKPKPKRGQKALRNKRSDRQLSEASLSIRNSLASSLSDISESNTFKVNAFAAWTPRPAIRYVEPPRLATARSQNASAASTRRERLPALTMSEENLHSRKRIDRLADNLDAGGLRELLERDRRRKERKHIEDHEKLHRKLRDSAEQQQLEEARAQLQDHAGEIQPDAEVYAEPEPIEEETALDTESKDFVPNTLPGTWLRDGSKSKETVRSRESLESVRVIGNIDDSSIRGQKLGPRRSFAPSQEMGMSQSTLSPSHSPSRHGLGSPTSSQIYGMTRDSTSDVSRTIDSERRLSDQSGRRINTLSSFFRRGSHRLKRSYRERFQDQTSDLSNASHESFSRIPTQSSGPPPYVPPKSFLRAGTIQRSQSKFTEHFGDEPLSPPDSRLQSPDIPEEPTDRSADLSGMENEGTSHSVVGARPIPGALTEENLNDDDNIPLSQSLASIDSEGSWMSGQFLRRISQRNNNNPTRRSQCSSPTKLQEEVEESALENGVSGNDYDARASHQDRESMAVVLPEQEEEETWHDQIARRPVLVNPTIRPKSNEGLLNRIQSFSAEEEFSPIEEHSAEFHSGESIHSEGEHAY